VRHLRTRQQHQTVAGLAQTYVARSLTFQQDQHTIVYDQSGHLGLGGAPPRERGLECALPKAVFKFEYAVKNLVRQLVAGDIRFALRVDVS